MATNSFDPVSSGLLNEKFYETEVLRALHNTVGGLRAAVNNKGIITGNQIQFPMVDGDGIARNVNDGSPTVPDQLLAQTKVATIVPYEAAISLYRTQLNATSTAASLRAEAAAAAVTRMENRFTDTILTAMMQYDDTNMELGSSSSAFDIYMLMELDYMTRKANWGDNDKFLLLPPEAEYAMKQDDKFNELWSNYTGREVLPQWQSTVENAASIRWYRYGGYNIGFMGVKGGKNTVGLPVAADTSHMGFAWKRGRVGFGMNMGVETRVFEDTTKQGNPIVFKSNGACGATIIDLDGVIGIKIKPTIS